MALTGASSLADDDRPEAVAGVETVLFDGEAVLFRPVTRTVHRLGGVAGAVWLMCDGNTTVKDIVAEVTEVFGEDPVVMRAAIVDGLTQLGREGLLVGHEAPPTLSLDLGVDIAIDGTKVLTPPESSEDEDDSDFAGSIVLRLGSAEPQIVIVRFDSNESLVLARTLFASWLDPSVSAAAHRAAFTVRLAPVKAGRSRGMQRVPQLRLGAVTMARSRDPHDVVRALASVLGGVHALQASGPTIWTGLRPFTRDGSAVLADIERPSMVDDVLLRRVGVYERCVWGAVVETDGAIVVPPALGKLNWAAVGISPPTSQWQRFALAGVVSSSETSTAGLVARLAQRSVNPGWFKLLATLAEDGRVLCASDVRDVRTKVGMLLGE